MIEVSLTKWEQNIAGIVGLFRQTESMGKGWKNNVSKSDPYNVHNLGACGELAAAKALNIYWPFSVNTFSAPDIGSGIQVRTAKPKDNSPFMPDLPIREKDKDDEVFLLVVGTPPVFRICGWAYGREREELGKKANPNGGTPAWFIPVDKLHPIETLPREAMEVTFE